jgi:hypothetical protein
MGLQFTLTPALPSSNACHVLHFLLSSLNALSHLNLISKSCQVAEKHLLEQLYKKRRNWDDGRRICSKKKERKWESMRILVLSGFFSTHKSLFPKNKFHAKSTVWSRKIAKLGEKDRP